MSKRKIIFQVSIKILLGQVIMILWIDDELVSAVLGALCVYKTKKESNWFVLILFLCNRILTLWCSAWWWVNWLFNKLHYYRLLIPFLDWFKFMLINMVYFMMFNCWDVIFYWYFEFWLLKVTHQFSFFDWTENSSLNQNGIF